MEKIYFKDLFDVSSGLSKGAKELANGDNPFLTFKTIFNNTFLPDAITDTANTNESEQEKYSVQRGDVFLTRTSETTDELGMSSVALKDYPNAVFNGFSKRLRLKPEVSTSIDLKYLGYFLRSRIFRDQVDSMSNTSTRASLNIEMINRLYLVLPDLITQERIGNILYLLDDKIKNNSAINQNLAEQAQVLYQKLCDDCTSNDLISLAEIMDYAGGSQPPASEFIFEEQPGYIRFVQIRDYDTDSHITYIPESSRNKLCEEHDIMIARYGASLGRICAGINGAYNVALAKVYPKKPYYREFLRCYLSSHTFYEGINNKGGRSAQAGFNQSDIKSFELSVPTQQQLQRFEDTASLLFEERLSLDRENRKLATLRDTLLPRLMSGETDVSTIEV